MAARFNRCHPHKWLFETPAPNWQTKCLKLARSKPKLIMFPSAHDISMSNYDKCAHVIRTLLDGGHRLLIVTKPKLGVIRQMIWDFPESDNIEFRFSITSSSYDTHESWEPNAPDPQERMLSIALAYQHCRKTSVSVEPALDLRVPDMVLWFQQFVTETIWIGLPRNLIARLTLNGESEEVKQRGRELLAHFTDDRVREIYENLKDNPKIRWKDSMRNRLAKLGVEV
jgi:DNA repair photolyase